MRYRGREEIFASILNAAGSGRRMTLTKMIFNCYLTHTQVIDYSKNLIKRGFLEYDHLERTFRTTPDGFKFLELQNEMSDMIKIQEELDPMKF
jgi:predicted transcriptional regulator